MVVTETVAAILQSLEKSGIRYVILRNYERLPEIHDERLKHTTDLDLVIHSDDLPLWRRMVADIARQFRWDLLVECDHWLQSPIRHHNIEVFRFYRYAPAEFFQVDVFHAFIALGLPLMDEGEILAGRVHDSRRRLTRIDPLKEILPALIKIGGLLSTGSSSSKIVFYSTKVQRVLESNREAVLALVHQYLGPWGVTAVLALAAGERARFASALKKAKLFFALRYSLRHPMRTLRYLGCRAREERLRFRTRQCGFIAGISAPSEEQRTQVRAILDELEEWNFIDEWAEREVPGQRTTARERAIMEQGGLIIEWVSPAAARLVVAASDTRASIKRGLVALVARRHAPLYAASSAQPTPIDVRQPVMLG